MPVRRDRSMLLCLVKGFSVLISVGLAGMAGGFPGEWRKGVVWSAAGVADKTGKGRSGRGQALMRSRRQQAG